MPVQVDVSDKITGKIKINGPVGGFTETYDFNGGSSFLTTATVYFNQIVTARAKLLAKNHAIVDTSLSLWSRTGDAYPGLTFQAGPELIGAEMTDPEVCNNTGLGLLFRFSTGDGKFVNRLLRGVRDSWITDNLSTLAAFTVYGSGDVPITYAPPDTAVNLLGNWLALVRFRTCLMVYHPETAPDVFTPYTFANVGFRRIGSRDLGARIGTSRGRQASMS